MTVTRAPFSSDVMMRKPVPGPSRRLTSFPVTTAVSAQADAQVLVAEREADAEGVPEEIRHAGEETVGR